MKCPQCRGSGKLPLFRTVVSCDRCHGTGVAGTTVKEIPWAHEAKLEGHKVTITGVKRKAIVGPDGEVLSVEPQASI